MNYKQARIFCFFAIIILSLLTIGGIVRCVRTPAPGVEDEAAASDTVVASAPKKPVAVRPQTPPIKSLRISERVGNLARQFADLNADHLVYARALGIEPISSARDIMRMRRPVVRVESNDNYRLDDLTHSYPYLVPEAAQLLDTIGVRFNRKLAQQGGGRYQIKVTSLLRTSESVNRLRRRNINSTENSAHLYGTTFDISYVSFVEGRFNTVRHGDGELKNLLAEVLLELRGDGLCLVKFERKQGCFHITATGGLSLAPDASEASDAEVEQ